MSTHASNWNGDDRTLCGVAEEGESVEGGDPAPIFAKPGESVTCGDCIAVIRHCRRFAQFREPRT